MARSFCKACEARPCGSKLESTHALLLHVMSVRPMAFAFSRRPGRLVWHFEESCSRECGHRSTTPRQLDAELTCASACSRAVVLRSRASPFVSAVANVPFGGCSELG